MRTVVKSCLKGQRRVIANGSDYLADKQNYLKALKLTQHGKPSPKATAKKKARKRPAVKVTSRRAYLRTPPRRSPYRLRKPRAVDPNPNDPSAQIFAECERSEKSSQQPVHCAEFSAVHQLQRPSVQLSAE